ncbi:protein of unknown function [Nitrosotalea devaniterrae]|uniref:Uncharacterized protein n=1 Tax=Nitrosotalea devaniterrae TaxID=1078905 RepID=A0A128A652_9ARCH|nr:protein of unknown function [Candidatus Nitrosotalea devanaterra]
MLEKINSCCDKKKILEIRVTSPEGEQLFHVCEKHGKLEYFKKYAISAREIK